ncbi:MAG: sporulation protein [Planctomycetia bacterium]|nr:sporulation protein [Planctomycetia bacterium]
MGLLSTVKGWLNIGGVKVKLEGLSPTLSRSGDTINGKVHLASKSDKQVLKMTYALVMETTTGKGEEKKTKKSVLGQSINKEGFEIKAGEEKEMDFQFTYAIPETLKDKGGMLGAMGKLGAFANSEKVKYYISACCDVKGTALDPEAKHEVTIVA